MRLQGLMQSQSPYFHSPILTTSITDVLEIESLNDQSCLVDFYTYGGRSSFISGTFVVHR